MPTITLKPELMARLESMAAQTGESVESLVHSLLADLVEHLDFEGNLPVLRVPPGAAPVTLEKVNRALNGTDE